jgi:hypothetical protein
VHQLKNPGGKDMSTGYLENNMSEVKIMIHQQCKKCEEFFDTEDHLEFFCSKECKEEALAELDSDSDECLSCQ